VTIDGASRCSPVIAPHPTFDLAWPATSDEVPVANPAISQPVHDVSSDDARESNQRRLSAPCALHRRKILLSCNENIIVRMRDLQCASITSKSRGIYSVTAS